MNDSLFSRNRENLAALLGESQDIGIILGKDQNVDKVAAGLALYLALLADQRKVQIISKKDPLVEFSHLVGVNRIRKHLEGGIKVLTVAVPYRDGEIEKVSYNIEGEKLNINLFAAGNAISFDEREVQFFRKGSLPSLLLSVGVPSYEELVGMVNVADKSAKLINIDNDSHNAFYGDVALVDPAFSSVSEIAAKIIQDSNLPIDVDIAQNLLDGITSATGNFSAFTTSSFAFEAASYLLRSGALRKASGTRGKHQGAVVKDAFIASLEKKAVEQNVSQVREDAHARLTYEAQRDEEETVANGAEEIPQDWFVPKVFKGSSQQKDE